VTRGPPVGAIALRPGSGGILYDSASIGGYAFSELDVVAMPTPPSRVSLKRVCLGKKYLFRCLTKLKVLDGELVGSDSQGTCTGVELVGSRWDLEFDTPDPVTGERNGVLDSIPQ